MKSFQDYSKETIVLIFCSLIILVTNVYPDFISGFTTFGQGDTNSYREIALFAPDIPDHVMHYHHAQRFFLPYFLGVVSKIFGLPLEPMFRVVNLALLFAIAFVFYRTLRKLNLPKGWLATICMLVLFNPYVSRYYLSFHFMANSLLFVFGFLLICRGFIFDLKKDVFLGLAIAAFGRQTALLLLPAVWFWYYLFCYRKDKIIHSIFMLILGSLSVLLLYIAGGQFASALGGKNINFSTMTGIFGSFQNFNLQEAFALFEFCVRGIMAHIWLVSLFIAWYLLAGKPKLGTKVWLLILISVSVCIQPFMGGPNVTGDNLVRLFALSNLGFALAFAMALQNKKGELSRRFLVSVFALGLIGSMHHQWSLAGKILHATPLEFAISFYAVTILIVSSYWANQRDGVQSMETKYS
jgi:hypothetical protein